jgi:hypothetical protein
VMATVNDASTFNWPVPVLMLEGSGMRAGS